ncbi:attractin-like protein 1 [Oculina patagonica]
MFIMFGERRSSLTLSYLLFVVLGCLVTVSNQQCSKNTDCKNGYCTSDKCICNPGWWGSLCQFCRLRLNQETGIITDGDGKYANPSKCSWLIDSQRPNSTINLDFEEFATECNWDHLYIYDGKSVESPLIAVISGLIKDGSMDKYSDGPVLKLRAKSGAAFLYFYSDKHYVEDGFRIKYSISKDCSAKCSFHGHCDKHENCVCDVGWAGLNCDIQTCISECVNGYCDNTTRLCVCESGFTGASCNITGNRGHWVQLFSKGQDLLQGRASHASALLGDYMWVFGGFSLNSEPFDNLIRYHIPSDSWEVVSPAINSSKSPSRRYGHSAIAHNSSLYVFGGRIDKKATSELWAFDTRTLHWNLLPSQADSPLSVAGHTATLVHSKMIVLFGYGPGRGYTDKVQEYDLETGKWSIYDAPTDIIGPTYGHSSVYDPVQGLIYIHGGFTWQGSKDELSTALTSYDPIARVWKTLKRSSVPRYLHSAVLLGGVMLVFGGNSHNGTVQLQSGLPCFSMDFLAYDTACDEWLRMPESGLLKGAGRYGHTALQVNRTMYVFGGFQGVVLNDVLSFTPGPCDLIKDKGTCQMHFNSSDCVWNDSTSLCLGPERCVQPQISAEEKCFQLGKSCRSCTSSLHGCSWCDGLCVKGKCPGKQKKIDSPAKCPKKVKESCPGQCEERLCHNLTSCEDCTSKKRCMWCESQKQCVSTFAYAVSFPFGQCRGWVQDQCPAVRCSGMKTCDDCHTLPGCGWCDDGSKTGLGQCMEGGDDGPFTKQANASLNQCPADHWYFIECPACQCNGHSKCINKNICKKCEHHTDGPHCEDCAAGYFGDAKNGGTCKGCDCNGHAESCDRETGTCECFTRWVTGDHCESCDEGESDTDIVGNATNGGTCYNKLQGNYAYTFNVSNKTRISFLNIPEKDDIDVEVTVEIKSGESALLNLSISSDVKEEETIVAFEKIGVFKQTFSHEAFNFGDREEFTFKVNVFDIKGFVSLEISFIQKQFLILNFFITFFACFFSLLFVVALAWKIKVRYSNYVMARQRVEEMKLMASRPFAKVCLAFSDQKQVKKSKKSPSAIAIQPMENQNAAVGVFMMRLPVADDGFTPIGQIGICCATALGTRGEPVPHSHSLHVTGRTVVKRSSMVRSCCL